MPLHRRDRGCKAAPTNLKEEATSSEAGYGVLRQPNVERNPPSPPLAKEVWGIWKAAVLSVLANRDAPGFHKTDNLLDGQVQYNKKTGCQGLKCNGSGPEHTMLFPNC
jgi:hypothetical protein